MEVDYRLYEEELKSFVMGYISNHKYLKTKNLVNIFFEQKDLSKDPSIQLRFGHKVGKILTNEVKRGILEKYGRSTYKRIVA